MIEIKNLVKKYDEHLIFNNINLSIDKNKITIILGKSGCGKTTLLRLISGLEKYDSGEILLPNLKCSYIFQEPRLLPWLTVFENIKLVNENLSTDEINELITMINLDKFGNSYPNELSGGMKSRVNLARAFAYKPNYLLMDEPFSSLDDFTRIKMQQELLKLYNKEKCSYIFQEPRLLPWLTVFENIKLVNENLSTDEINELITMINLDKFGNSYPNELSGGMKSRVNLARAFAYKPNYLLMDEPFSSLDDFTRIKMQQELLKLYNKEKCGILFVTHNIDEALMLADKIIVLKSGEIYSTYSINSKIRDLLSDDFINLKRKIRDDIWRL